MDFVTQYSWLIPLLPLLAAVVVGLTGRKMLKGLSHLPIWAGVLGSAILSFVLLFGMLGHHDETKSHAVTSTWFTWFGAGDVSSGILNVSAGALLDPLSSVMLCVVCGIGFLITVFAAGYMKGESGYWRFFAYLGLFIFAMTCLVMGENLVMLYLGWEGVGLCSYLLIGYYYEKPAARDAAKKAFIVNRIGDFGFAVGIVMVWYCFGTLSYFGDGWGTNTGFVEMFLKGHFAQGVDPIWANDLVYWIPFALMLGAFGKSAQFPLHVWLPDAMEGPTPVSALIHAATMVTAGVYMIARCGPVFTTNPDATLTIAIIGCITAVLGGVIALKQYDLKKVFAYSTISQLGFMFVAVGALAPVAGVFHLVTHAFFKALLFLSSGVVMHAMLGHLDLRKMSGIRKQLPLTTILIGIGSLALAGFPLTAGFFSKDEIVDAAGQHYKLLQFLLLGTALLTAYYTFRVYFRVFFGPNVVPMTPADAHAGDVEHAAAHGADDSHAHHDDHGHHNHEPLIMIAPLVLLAAGALFAGLLNLPFALGPVPAHALGNFLGHSPSFVAGWEGASGSVSNADTTEYATAALGFGQHVAEGHAEFNATGLIVGGVIAIVGIGLAFFMHLASRKTADDLAASPAGLGVGKFLYQKLYIDELYNALFVGPARVIGYILGILDDVVVDGIVFLVSAVTTGESLLLKNTVQRGYLQGYALAAIVGIAAILAVVFVM
ncbi:MAG: NADH-quinone oxidoreductase subunit L [Tepidisphaeraceae bacterium]